MFTDTEEESSNGGVKGSPKSAKSSPALSNGDVPNSSTKLTFKDPEAFLPTEISERLLYNLCEKKALSDLTIALFDAKTTRLRCVPKQNNDFKLKFNKEEK